MKTRKKLLHSTLILALAFGQTSGTVVEAVSVLNAIGSSNTKKVTKEKEETTSTSNTKDVTPSLRASEENPTFTLAKPIPSDIQVPSTDFDRKVGNHIISYVRKKIPELFKDTDDNYEIGDTITYELPSVIANWREQAPPGFWNGWDEKSVNWMGLLRRKTAPDEEIYYITTTSESGNWQIHITPSDAAANAKDNATKDNLYVTFTRVKIAPPQKEIFKIPKVAYFYYAPTIDTSARSMYLPLELAVDFQNAENTIGKIKATVKSGDHTLGEHLSTIPKPEEYVTAENTRGKVTYEWVTKPDTSKVGKQDVKIAVKDDTGRSTEVTFPITVKELLSIKKATDEIYQYDAIPDVKDYFEVTTEGAYTLRWENSPNTSVSGNYNWQATVKTADGREETKSMTMRILPHPGIQLKLKPIEDRTMTLVESSDTLANTFKNYIEEAIMLGEPVAIDDLEFVADESSKTDFQSVGVHEVKITVQAKHPVSNVMIKGTGTTTVNVLWGNTILMRSVDGHSAGAFSLDVGNSNGASATLSFRQGIESPLNVGVGSLQEPFGLYYSLEILRNGNSVYKQDVTNRATLQEIMNAYGDTDNNVTVQMGDIIQITHPDKAANSSVVMINEKENDFTYGTEIARYRVTPYGFDPAPVVTAESAAKTLVLGEDSSQINPKDLVKNVMINGAIAKEDSYTVEPLGDFDTRTVGKRTMRVKISTKDGLGSQEIEVAYNVKWGNTFVVRGLNGATVGAFSLLKNNDQWAIHASQGVDGTDLTDPVNNYFGRETYYSIEVLEGATSKYLYEVAGNQSIGEAINGFNNGQPLKVNKGDVVKVYHADPTGRNLLMEDELVKDYTIGSNYAYYKVTDNGLAPILNIDADSKPQEFTLGEDSSNVDGTRLINSITINDISIANNQYTVTQVTNFDTSIAGERNIRIRIDTKDGMISKEIDVPYKVKWGDTILMKAQNGKSAGAFSLQGGNSSTNRVLMFTQGLETDLDTQISTDPSLYYSIEISRDDRSIYKQEIPGRATLQQVMDNFGTNKRFNVQVGDVIKLYQPQRTEGSSILLVDEQEKDYTFNSPYAYYRVTEYGLKPVAMMEAQGANKEFVLEEKTSGVDLNQLLAQVTINGEKASNDLYTIRQLSDFDTTTVGTKKVQFKLTMPDDLAEIEVEIPYEVKWGSTFLLKGLDNENVGAYSIVKQDDHWTIQAGKGDESTILDNPVNNVFGRDVYYRIEVVANPEATGIVTGGAKTVGQKNPLMLPIEDVLGLESTDLLANPVKYQYEVPGNLTVGQAIAGFNDGQPLPIDDGDIVKVYHAQPGDNNLLMRDNLSKNYTAGSNYAQYQVANHEFEPITDMKAEPISQELTLGEDPSTLDEAEMVKNVTYNGEKLSPELYKVEQVSSFDTSTIGAKKLSLKLSTADGVTTKDVEVPYEVKWGSTIQLKNKNGDTVGTFGLAKENDQLQLQSLKGKDGTVLSNRVTEFDDTDVYYGIEVLNKAASKYKYEVRGTQTIDQAISRFNNGKPLKVNVGDTVKVYHKDSNSNLLMSEEMERNYTYGSNYAYYNVTEYGFEPTGELAVTPNEVTEIVKGTESVDLKSLLKEVKVNGKTVPKNAYMVSLSPGMEIDTSELNEQEQKVSLVVKTERSYGTLSTETEATYKVVEKGKEDNDQNGTDGSSDSGKSDADQSENEKSGDTPSSDSAGSLPKTNETKNAKFSAVGAFVVMVAGTLMIWRRRKNSKDTKK